MPNWGRRWAATQLGLSIIAPSLLPYIGTDAVLVVLAVSNAAGGIAGLYQKPSSPPPRMGGPWPSRRSTVP